MVLMPEPLDLRLQDPMADPGERALAQELRGIGLVSYEVPEWKTKVGCIGLKAC